MDESYIVYTLKQCKSGLIDSVCSITSDRYKLINLLKKEFEGCSNNYADLMLFEFVESCLKDNRVININKLDEDCMSIYIRCSERYNKKSQMNNDEIFDFLSELNWLLASVHHSEKNNLKGITLLNNFRSIKQNIKEYLEELYYSALKDKYESDCIEEAYEARKKFFRGCYPFKYEESKQYISIDLPDSELRQYHRNIIANMEQKMASFYGLTATAALENDLRRYGCE